MFITHMAMEQIGKEFYYLLVSDEPCGLGSHFAYINTEN